MAGRVETGRVIERYVVEGVLGSGGMASVYLLRHRHLGTHHALKVLTTIGPNAELRLMLEGRVQAALRHPNIVAVTDILEVDGTPGLLMEYVPPPSLAVWLDQHQPSVEEAESLFRGIVDGVRHAHRYGLVHRDLKPSNVLLARYEGEGLVPKVADFGLAKLLSDDPVNAGQTRSGLTMGTPQYMAPEQFRDAKKVDRRADMFSLGCVLYELLAGRPPFAWSDFITLYNQILAREYPRLPASVPQRLVDAVEALLEPERDARLSDCEGLISLLDGKGLPAGTTVTPEDLGRLVDVPVLRDRVSPAPRPAPLPLPGTETFTAAEGVSPRAAGRAPAPDTMLVRAAPTLAADSATLADAHALDDSPRALPMPTMAPAPPTMVPEAESLAPAPSPVERPRSPDAAAVPWLPILGAALAASAAIAAWTWQTRPAPVGAPGVEVAVPTQDPPAAAPGTPAPSGPELVTAAPSTPPSAVAVEPLVAAPADPKPREAAAVKPAPKPEAEPAVVAPKPAPDPVAVAIAPEAPPPPPIATTAHLSLDGQSDASRVEAVGSAGRFPLPGDVPPGSYDVYAWFPDAPQTKTTHFTVAAGDRVSLRCMAFSMSCIRR